MGLLAQSDPLLSRHTESLKNNQMSYLSMRMQNQLMKLMAETVRLSILTVVKRSGPSGIVFHTTPDLSHRKQGSKILQYVKVDYKKVSYEMKKSFVDFVEIKGPREDAETLFTDIVEKLHGDGLLIYKCIAQSYDNAQMMSGDIGGVQSM